ncbi:MAG TPA: hypothetical protein PL169_26520 [Leptospiraceae bacterium]|nr:hypothetical protein [Leptospiraceae bacterium]
MNLTISFEEAARMYLDFSKKEKEGEIFAILLDYLDAVYDKEEEPILLEDLTLFEIDDFLNFFLEDNFEDEAPELIKRSKSVLRSFEKFVKSKKLLSAEELEEWTEVLK